MEEINVIFLVMALLGSWQLCFFMLGVIKVKGLWPNRQQCSPFARAMCDTRKTRYNNCAIAQYIKARINPKNAEANTRTFSSLRVARKLIFV